MLACVYPPENFKSKAVTVKVRHGKSRRKTRVVSIKEKSDNKSNVTSSHHELPVGGGGAVLVLSELESMAARQQREIAQQRRLLEQREARLAVLRGTQEPAQQEKLARLRHRLDQQQSKLNRLRLLRSQTDQSRANNATLTSDLDCIRALFNEKEKELSLAVAKVEELTRQLEELRGRHNNAGAAGGGHIPTPASAELEKLRRELMYRNKMNEQQNQVVSQQRLALAQRQAEMASIDARIVQLQGRLQRKKALNQRMSQQLGANNRTAPNPGGFTESKLDFGSSGKSRPAGNIAAIEPYSHIPNDNDFSLNKNDPKYQTLPYNTKFTVNFKAAEDDVNKNKIQHSASASQIGQRTTLQQFGHQIAHSQSQSHIQSQSQPLGSNQQQQQNGSPNFSSQSTNNNNNNNNNNNSSSGGGSNNNNNNNNNNFLTENQNSTQNLRIHNAHQAKQPQHTSGGQNQGHRNPQTYQKPVSSVAPSFPVKSPIYQTSSTKIHPVMPQTLSLIGRGQSYPVQSQSTQQNSPNNVTQEQNFFPSRHNYIPQNSGQNLTSYASHSYGQNQGMSGTMPANLDSPNERLKFEPGKAQEKFDHVKQQQQQYEQQIRYEQNQTKLESLTAKYEQNVQQTMKHEHAAKPFEYERLKAETEKKTMNFGEVKTEDKTKPALPPKPSKPNPPPRLTHHDKIEVGNDAGDNKTTNVGVGSRSEKEEDIPPIPTTEPPESPTETQLGQHQVIKARLLGLKKAPFLEQPKLRYPKSNVHVSINRRIEMPPAFLFPETEIPADLMQTEQHHQQQTQIVDISDVNCKKSSSLTDELVVSNDKLEDSDIVDALNIINIEDKLKPKSDLERKQEIVEIDGVKAESVIRRKKGNLKSTTGKANLSRRVSFDPLALLLDASLEGELELVKKTAKEVANPSSANDEGITALHNAICAGHLEIVKFLVEFGCDVNAQDSDGWTPLHCAASCNNLAMVRFLVEHGACIFATTLSDHETAAEKCEEDEEGFDGCSEYLYSVQEKLGIMNNGQVYAVFDYEAQHSDELSLKNGDSLIILRKGDDNEREWWWSKLGHREGYVPRNLLGLYPRVQPTKVD